MTLHTLHRCDWGHKMWLGEEPEPCVEQPTERFQLHRDSDCITVEACVRHAVIVLAATLAR